MKVRNFNRVVVAIAVSAVSLVGTSALAGTLQDSQQNEKQRQKQDQKQNQKAKPQRLSQQEQEQRISQQRQRITQYGEHLVQQRQPAQQQAAQLQQQKRSAQLRFQVDYSARLQQQQSRVQSTRNYNYGRDPYFYTPSNLRYSRGGQFYETNQYGATLLRQAVNNGYEEGFRAGQADQQDRWAADYQNSYAYQDANYGYTGLYVDRDDYNYYFREGFRRGYEDGYNGRHQYGTYSGGKGSILGAVLGAVLIFEAIRR